MNQAFRHNFNVGKDNTSKPDQAHTGTFDPRDDYIEAGHTRNICFVWLDGKRIFLNYSYLISGEFSPLESIITLHFTTHIFIVKGVNLQTFFMTSCIKLLGKSRVLINAIMKFKKITSLS